MCVYGGTLQIETPYQHLKVSNICRDPRLDSLYLVALDLEFHLRPSLSQQAMLGGRRERFEG